MLTDEDRKKGALANSLYAKWRRDEEEKREKERNSIKPVPVWVTTTIAAKALGVSPRTVLRMLESGKLEGWRFFEDSWWCVKKSSIEQLLGASGEK